MKTLVTHTSLQYVENTVSRHVMNYKGGFVIGTTIIKSNVDDCRLPVQLKHKRIFKTLKDAQEVLRAEVVAILKARKFVLTWTHAFSYSVDKTNGNHYVFTTEVKEQS